MKAKQVDHYGIHLSPNGLWFLVQEDEQNDRGLNNVKSNIKVKTHRRLPATHAVSLSVGESNDSDNLILGTIEKDKVGRLLLPNPNNAGQIVFVENDNLPDIIHSTELGSPLRPPVVQAWMLTTGEANGQSRRTNIQPFIILNVTPKWMTQYGSEIISLFELGTRPLILVGNSDVVLPPSVKRLKTNIFRKLSKIPTPELRRLGAIYIKNWMRNARV